MNPFLASIISTVSVLFISADHCIGVSLGMSVKPNQFPPVSECPPQSHYKSLIATITSIKKKIPLYILPFVDAITFT
ncbi:unnamed protein product [Staurois parvus]|uniref:Secreted protein n=1 Tax=Staurois parvus TaxID=386267 RepID=A0ABN9FCD6_9NEOB|nr:unnamed protein product [Staurois parvus]